ncbi:MAG: tRNA 2-thiouridine(34) synthase MnmA [Candidatus Eremiobacteraeota bacterium]|nr:tRNA 2-thiouridine(34) synthase MnmA [Candidatus Eremiobacteraeota bacterium]
MTAPKGTRVVAAMSGGVDSAVAAGLLAEAGCEVIGVTMKMYAPTRPAHAKSCCGAEDFDDARRSAATLGIPHYVLDFEEVFRRHVVDRFAADYAAGRTPNPCVACNNEVKLGALRAYAQRLGARFVATGHYARLEHADDGPHLYRSASSKDQAYALAQLAPEQLGALLLPLGRLSKPEPRAHAARLGLSVAEKQESQDICFVEGGDYRDVLAGLAPGAARRGPVVASDGSRVGTHEGIGGYTVGQRRRLPAADGPRYVTHIDPDTNTIVIGREDELAVDALVARALNLIRPERFERAVTRVLAMTRYRSRPVPATAVLDAEGRLRLTFDEPHRAVAPGQLVALLDPGGEEILGGATIERGLRER